MTRWEAGLIGKVHDAVSENWRAPAERDMQIHFQVTPPAVHDMVLKLERRGFISREPGVPRSIRLLLKREELPDLE
jgi:DNA-binding MarR family transcriptional regulator